jgi:hypothetical protein
MIELKDTNQGSFYVVDENDIVGLNVCRYDGKEYYSVCIKNVTQWISVTAECFYEVKALLSKRLEK